MGKQNILHSDLQDFIIWTETIMILADRERDPARSVMTFNQDSEFTGLSGLLLTPNLLFILE